MHFVFAFLDREFALHMFTVGVLEAAVYLCFFSSGVYICKTKFLALAKGTLTGDQRVKLNHNMCATGPTTLQYVHLIY